MSVIYALAEMDGEVRYIGKANDPFRRFKQHLHAARRGQPFPVYNWIRKLSAVGRKPNLIVLEKCDADWQSAEIRLIAEHRGKGARLLNATDGGDGVSPSFETLCMQHAIELSNNWRKHGESVIETMVREEPLKFAVIAYAIVKTMKSERPKVPVSRKVDWIASLRAEANRQIAIAEAG